MTRRKKPAVGLTARNADRHALYETSVQRPEVMVGFIEELAEAVMDREVRVLREDFCGTAHLASAWVQSGEDRAAVGVDLDAETLGWAEAHNGKPLGEASERLTLIEGDVMGVEAKADVVVSLNFSHFIYHEREALLRYLKHARGCLAEDGFMILDAFGGPGSVTPGVDERNFSDFDYLWEQASFNPLTNGIVCHIHFRFRNGSMLKRAFTYDWRMWSLPELQELLREAGFGDVGIYFESEEGFVADFDEVHPEAWVAYVVALASAGEGEKP